MSVRGQLVSAGVTGTNGKTTVVMWLAAALEAQGGPVLRTSTVGIHLGDECLDAGVSVEGMVDALVRARRARARFAILELTSQLLEAGFASMWPCHVGVFTNLTHDHLDAHDHAEAYLAAKAQLFVRLSPGGTAVLNGCDPAARLIAEVTETTARRVLYGVRQRVAPWGPLDLEASSISVSWEGTRFVLAGAGTREREVRLRAIGAHFVENALAALSGAVALGVPLGSAVETIAEAPTPPGRFEVVHRRPYVVVDYAHNPDGLVRTLEAARALAPSSVTLVFGAGGRRDETKRRPMGSAARAADRIFITSDNPRDEDPRAIALQIAEGVGAHAGVLLELDRSTAIERAIREARDTDVVVIAGRGHEARQELADGSVDLSDVELARAVMAR